MYGYLNVTKKKVRDLAWEVGGSHYASNTLISHPENVGCLFLPPYIILFHVILLCHVISYIVSNFTPLPADNSMVLYHT